MQNNKTYDIMNGTGTANNKPFASPLSVPWKTNTSAFDTLGSADKILLASKTDDYKDKQYKEEHKKPNAETKLLQETLNKNGYKGSDNKPLVVDGIYGPNTEYAHNNAVKNNWKNLSSQFDIERDEISSAVNKVYSSLMEKADNRKLNISQEDVKTLQKILNDGGYTDLQGNTLAVDGILGDKTKYAFEKYIQGDIPKAEVFELQKILNKYDIKDRNQKALAVDGKLGPKTDSAVYNAVAKYSNKKSNKTLDKISDFLTWASLIPGLDTLSNLAAIPVDLLRGDYVSAGLSAAGMIPGYGEIADTAKLARMADKAVDMAKVVDKVSDAGKVADTIIDTAKATDNISDAIKSADKINDAAKVVDNVSLPSKPAQVKHIFGNRPGHLPDTPANRKLLTDTANTPKFYRGTDKFGNQWHVQIDDKGRQVWTRSQNGTINEGGRNNTPRPWDKDTGLDRNPTPRKRKYKSRK